MKKERKFEIPYNFDPEYIPTLKNCNLITNSIKYIYMAPFHEDYTTIIREDIYGARFLTREQYVEHITKINHYFHGRMQLLLQSKTNILSKEKLNWYIKLGFTNFCCGNPEQAKMIKDIDNSLTVIGSIVLHITREDLLRNKDYQTYFDEFVLDFSYGRNLQKIKEMPNIKPYMILANSCCHAKCDGDHHWNIKTNFGKISCPGKYPAENPNFNDTILIRPMDLFYFDPYIDTFKLQDRSWPTWKIIQDIILYTAIDYNMYPGIEYNEIMYDTYEDIN